MDSARLLAVLDDVTEEWASHLVRPLAGLIQAATTARDNSTQDHTEQINAAFARLEVVLAASVTNVYPPSRRKILEAIEGSRFVGRGAASELYRILNEGSRTPAGLVTSLTEYQTEAAAFFKSTGQAAKGLTDLGLRPDVLGPEEGEVGVLIPEALVDNELGKLIKQLKDWNVALRGLAELTGDEEREVFIRGLAKGSIELWVFAGLAAVDIVGRIVERAMGWYKTVLEIRQLRAGLEKVKAPSIELKLVKAHEKQIVDDGIAELVKELAKEIRSQRKAKKPPTSGSQERDHELEVHLQTAIRTIVKLIDNGGEVEARVGQVEELEEPDTPPDNAEPEQIKSHSQALAAYEETVSKIERLEELNRRGARLTELPPRTAPILQITDGSPSDDNGGEEKKRPGK